jgi:hypothetical protein
MGISLSHFASLNINFLIGRANPNFSEMAAGMFTITFFSGSSGFDLHQ